MKKYEALFLIKPDLEQDELKPLFENIEGVITKYGGSIEARNEWGKKRLAYKIGKYSDGIYYLLSFSAKPEVITELNNEFKINESVMRVCFDCK